MKIISILSLLLAGLLVVINRQAQYWLGYYETPQALEAADPLVLLMAECVLFLILVVFSLSSIFLKKDRIWMLVSVFVYLPFVFLADFAMLNFTKPGGELVLQGLHDRVMRDYTLDDLRHFAKDVDEAGLIKGNWISHGDITGLTDQQKETFAQLGTKYPFMHWLDDGRFLNGPSLLSRGDDGVVDFEWGGALPGYWGCSISVNGAKNDPGTAFFKTLKVSDDIYFYFE